MATRSDYQDEVGWPQLARDVQRQAHGADVVVTRNYGEAGAMELFGHGLPPVASGQVTFRYWRPQVGGQRAGRVQARRGELLPWRWAVGAAATKPAASMVGRAQPADPPLGDQHGHLRRQ